jgi:hypothetical protein
MKETTIEIKAAPIAPEPKKHLLRIVITKRGKPMALFKEIAVPEDCRPNELRGSIGSGAARCG